MVKLQYNEIVAKLRIDKHALDDELEMQSEIQFMISEELIKAREHMLSVENDLEIVESKAFRNASTQMADTGKKPSVDYVKHSVKADPSRNRKVMDVNEARVAFEKWESLYWAWWSRSDALRALASLATANYYSVDTTYADNRDSSRRHHQDRPTRRRGT